MAGNSKISRIIKFANTLASRRTEIPAWFDYYIYRKIERINNKTKTMKRQTYGYRDQEIFELKIISMHVPIKRFVGRTIVLSDSNKKNEVPTGTSLFFLNSIATLT